MKFNANLLFLDVGHCNSDDIVSGQAVIINKRKCYLIIINITCFAVTICKRLFFFFLAKLSLCGRGMSVNSLRHGSNVYFSL